jgi:hypothetical protein
VNSAVLTPTACSFPDEGSGRLEEEAAAAWEQAARLVPHAPAPRPELRRLGRWHAGIRQVGGWSISEMGHSAGCQWSVVSGQLSKELGARGIQWLCRTKKLSRGWRFVFGFAKRSKENHEKLELQGWQWF